MFDGEPVPVGLGEGEDASVLVGVAVVGPVLDIMGRGHELLVYTTGRQMLRRDCTAARWRVSWVLWPMVVAVSTTSVLCETRWRVQERERERDGRAQGCVLCREREAPMLILVFRCDHQFLQLLLGHGRYWWIRSSS